MDGQLYKEKDRVGLCKQLGVKAQQVNPKKLKDMERHGKTWKDTFGTGCESTCPGYTSHRDVESRTSERVRDEGVRYTQKLSKSEISEMFSTHILHLLLFPRPCLICLIFSLRIFIYYQLLSYISIYFQGIFLEHPAVWNSWLSGRMWEVFSEGQGNALRFSLQLADAEDRSPEPLETSGRGMMDQTRQMGTGWYRLVECALENMETPR